MSSPVHSELRIPQLRNATGQLIVPVSRASVSSARAQHVLIGPGDCITVVDGANNVIASDICALIDALPHSVLVSTADGAIICGNARLGAEFDIDLENIEGQHLTALFPEVRSELLKQSINPDGQSLVTSIVASPGSHVPVELHLAPLALDGDVQFLLTLRDISSTAKLQDEEHRTNQLLLDEAQKIAHIGSWRWDVQRDVIVWSSELFRIFGVEPDTGNIDFDFFVSLLHPADREDVTSTIASARERGTSFDFEHRIVRPDGNVRLVYGRGSCQTDDAGNVTSMIGTVQDVTERKSNEAQAFRLALEQAAREEAERTKERFQFLAEVSESLGASLDYETTLQNLVEVVIPRIADWCTINTLEPDGSISRLSVAHRIPEKQRILEEIRDRNFIPHGDPDHPLTRALKDGRPSIHYTLTEEMLRRMARSDEHMELVRELGPTSVMLVPLIARGRAFGVLTFGHSDSPRRFTDDDLQLAIEVAHRAAVSIDNAQLFTQAQHAARAREEFVSLVTHELKTPLTVIKGYMQVLERYLDKPEWDHERIIKTRERLSSQVTRLELLIADILDVSRIQHGRLELNASPDVDVTALAHHVLSRFDDAIERTPHHTMRVIADGPVIGYWDPLRLDQVFSNLISNAIKYSPEGGIIEIRIRQDEGWAIIDVSDEGVGISAEEQERLFQPFQRGAASSRGISGTGLGLYITRQIVEEHAGRIWLESDTGKGTTFRVEIPIHHDPIPEDATAT